MKNKIRKADRSDIPVIRAMAEVAFRHTYREILSAAQMEYMMEWMYSTASLEHQLNQGHVYHILNREGRDVGYVSYNLERVDDEGMLFHLQKIYLLPDCQKMGLGALLLRCAEASMRDEAQGQKWRYELNVNRNNEAVGFYEHMGLTRLREGDFAIGEGFFMNDYIMGRRGEELGVRNEELGIRSEE